MTVVLINSDFQFHVHSDSSKNSSSYTRNPLYFFLFHLQVIADNK